MRKDREPQVGTRSKNQESETINQEPKEEPPKKSHQNQDEEIYRGA